MSFKTEKQYEVKLDDNHYAQVECLHYGNGEIKIAILKNNNKGYDWYRQNCVAEYKFKFAYTPPKKGEPGYDSWYVANDETEDFKKISSECPDFELNNIIKKAKIETTKLVEERNNFWKLNPDERLPKVDMSEKIQQAMRDSVELKKQVSLQEAKERDLYGGLTWREYQDEL